MLERIDIELRQNERREDKYMRSLPICCMCGESIQDEQCFLIGNEYYCRACAEDEYLVYTDEHMNYEDDDYE